MRKRISAMLLSLAIMASVIPAPALADADDGITAGIKATLRFDYPQTAEKVDSSNIKIKMYRDNDEIGEIPMNGEITGEISGHTNIVKKNTEGGVLGNETEIGYLDVEVSDLALGSYSFKLTGDGYNDYTTDAVKLDNYSRQVILGTGDKTFSIGDVNNDGKVNTTDRDLVTKALGTDNSEYDLNGDGKVNIVDLAYVNHQIGARGQAQMLDTELIAKKAVNAAETEKNVNVLKGSVNNIFSENNTEAVTIASKEQAGQLSIPIELNEASEMDQIEVISPDVTGALTAGNAVITYVENGKEKQKEVFFDSAIPEGVSLLSENENRKTVVISLGKRVAVKKVVINVTKVAGVDGNPTYAVVQEVKFLKDIVPENPAPQVLTVKNVKAQPMNESVKLTWSEFPNISGYKVLYGMDSGKLTEEMSVNTNSATIKGLKNLKTYYFTVIPTSDDWEGGRSEIISAIPQPSSAPLKPDMITVKPMDSALSLSWKETEDATYYRVFYKKETDTDFVEIPAGRITEPKAVIGGLENKTVYHLYVIAGNSIGEGPKSDLTEGIPDKEVVEPPKIPTLHQIKDNIEKIEMGNSNNYDRNEYPNGFDVWNVADGDYGTHWTARVFWESNQFTFTFKEAKEMNYMVYVPRQDDKYKQSLEKYSITVWDEEGNQKDLVSGKNIAINSNTTGYMILPFEKTKVKKLAVAVAQWAGSPKGVSLAEAVFYESDNLASDVRALFANDTYTALSAEALADKAAAQAKIDDLRAQANDAEGYYVDKDILLDELELAEKLLNGDSGALGITKNGVQSRSTSVDGKKYGQAGSDLQPLGVVAYATEYAERNKLSDTQVTIYAHIPEGESVSVVPTQYYAEANAWQGGAIPLQNGRNLINIPKIGTQTSERGGALYLKYSGSKPDEIALHIRKGAIAIPMLELSDWYSIDEAARRGRIAAYVEELSKHTSSLNKNDIGLRIANSTEISMPNVLLSVAAQPVMNAVKPTGKTNEDAVNTLYNNVLAWEDIMHVVNTTQGIDNTLQNSDMQSRQNIRYMRMFAKAFMYAAGSHIGIGYGSVGGMACGKPISMLADGATANGIFGWGIAHEIGHNMDKLGKAEITNNIYSLMAQTYDGKQNTLTSRLESSNKYAGIYEKVAAGRPGMSNDVFVQLGMYWQLHLAYDEGDAPMDFYNKLFKEWKSGSISAPTGDERFALTASKIANKNLTEFFESWGMRLSDATKQTLKTYPEETRKIQYLCDDSRRYRLNGGAAASGETTAAAAIDPQNEKQVNVTFSTASDNASVLGWEIKRNGKTIAFVANDRKADIKTPASGSYADVIGSANNLSFSYSVQAVDLLGNKTGAAADAGQVRVSYVKTIDKSEYTETKNADDSIKIVMNSQTAVSGVKITNAPSSGVYTVSVTRDSGETTVAKNGDFAKNETPDAGYYVSYFNKPGTTDTRIWTYDAKEIAISGVPAGASVELISYAGDNIEFTSDAAIGVLKSDYVYDNGEGGTSTIKAGTIVVTGSYRGDPMYNTVQINGKFISVNPETNEETVTERAIDGYALLFAEIPADGEVSDISDGIFIFVPNVQKEAELQGVGDAHDCSADSLLPAQINAELYRTDTIDSTDSKRKTSDTIWIDSPSYASMPDIILEGDGI